MHVDGLARLGAQGEIQSGSRPWSALSRFRISTYYSGVWGSLMAGLLIAWVIGTFVYFKITIDWAFDADIMISAAVLIAILEGASTVFVAGLHAVQLLNYDWANGSIFSGFRSAIAKTSLSLFATLLFNVVFARLIIFWFSKDLNHEIQNFCQSGCFVHGTIVKFTLIIIIPLVINYTIIVFGTYRTAK